MDYNYFIQKLNSRFDIVNGELQETEKGKFIVTTNFIQYSIYLNPITKTWAILAPYKSYLGRKYLLRYSDCITLNGEWLDDHYGTNYINVYKNFSRKEFSNFFKTGLTHWYLSNGFYSVTDPKPGDTLLYAWRPNYTTHVGVYLENNKILHHIPHRLSSIDICDSNKIIEIFRYGSNS